MNIKILKNFENYEDCKATMLNENLVLEKVYSDIENSGLKKIRYILLDISDNSRREILPQYDKYNIGDVKNVSSSSDYIYFFTFNQDGDDSFEIRLMRYNIITGEHEIIFKYSDDITMYSIVKKLKVFVLNEFYLLVQQEYLKTNAAENCSGFFKFESFLYNINDQKIYSVVDENLSTNGINDIIPVSENLCIMKTGFPLLQDNRYSLLEKEEVSVEAVSLVNIGQLISDILIMQTSITFDTIDQAYYNKTIPYIEVQDNYLIYSVTDTIENYEEVVFYNINDKESTRCINKNVFKMEDLAKHYIINDEPYICISKATGIEFVNLKKAKIEYKFEENLKLETVEKNMFIFSGKSEKGLLRKSYHYCEVYDLQQNMILREKGDYFECKCFGDNLYLFII